MEEVATAQEGARSDFLVAAAAGGWAAAMGFSVRSASSKGVELTWSVGPQHLQPWGLVHGGVLSGAVETACSIGASLCVGPSEQIAGIENQTSFLRPVSSGELVCRATPIHVGRTSQLWEARIVDARDRLVASGRLRVFVLSKTDAKPPAESG